MSKRLDQILLDRGHAPTLEKSRAMILAGEVWSGQTRLDKAGNKYPDDIPIEIKSSKEKYVSRAGEKLLFALEKFNISPKGKICLDIGASTGGFTECLLDQGAEFVFSVDVGYGLLDSKLRNHPQVECVEKTNARFLTRQNLKNQKAESISFLVADVSFISLQSVISPLVVAFPGISDWVLLFKPQFEVGPENLRKGGIVKDSLISQEALRSFQMFMEGLKFECKGGPLESPVKGQKSGNQEYLFHFSYRDPSVLRRP